MKWVMMFLVLGLVGMVSGADYYVSESLGNNSYDGLSPTYNGTSGPRDIDKVLEVVNLWS